MEDIRIHISEQEPKKIFGTKRIINNILKEKLNAPVSIISLIVVSISVAFLIYKYGPATGIILGIAAIAIPAVYAIIAYPKIGITILFILSYTIMFIGKIGINFPIGTIIDGVEFLLIIGLLIQKKTNPEWKIYRNPITAILLLWIAYNILELINPVAASRLAWLYTIRSIAIFGFMYFVFMYNMRDIKFIRFIFKLWIGLSILGALYGLKQEYFGFTDFEQRIIDSDPNFTSLLFIGGHWRKFSIFTDPVSFAYNMIISAILCISLLTAHLSLPKKITLFTIALICIFSMMYSGTRGAYVLIPAFLLLFFVLNYSRKILIISLFACAILGFFILVPTSNPTINRFQTAFRPSEDESFKLRKANQKKIQPYILSHPLGGGLGATGVWGQRFSPNSFLANFPPDSGYVRIAVEQGWVGLLLFCTFIFMILRTGIINFYKIRNPELKSYCLAMTLIVFALNIGNYPQEAFVQFPSNVLFYFAISMINITRILDQQKQSAANTSR